MPNGVLNSSVITCYSLIPLSKMLVNFEGWLNDSADFLCFDLLHKTWIEPGDRGNYKPTSLSPTLKSSVCPLRCRF